LTNTKFHANQFIIVEMAPHQKNKLMQLLPVSFEHSNTGQSTRPHSPVVAITSRFAAAGQ